MFLDSNRKLIAVLTSAKTTLNLSVALDVVDLTSTTTTAVPLGTYTNGLTPVDIVPSPAAATIRKINGMTVYGRDTAAKVIRIYGVDSTPATGSIAAGSFVVGNTYQITAIGTTDFTLIGATANTVGVIFDATGAGTGSGTASTAYQQIDMILAVDDVLGYTDTQGWYTQDPNGARKLLSTTQFGVSNTWTAQQTFTVSPIVPSLPFTDNSTNSANTAFVQAVQGLNMATLPLANITGGTYSFAGNGSGCTLTYTVTTGAISSVTSVAAGGSGYAVGDCLLVSGGNYNSVIRVATITGSAVATVTILYGGTGYSNGTAIATSNALADPYKWRLSGTLTSNATFILPSGTYLNQSDQYIIANNTTGAFRVLFYVSNGSNAITGNGIEVYQGTNNSTNTQIETDGVSDVWLSQGLQSTNNQTFRNRIINGDYTVSQVNGSSAVTVTAAAALQYVIDQWYAYCTGANVTGQRVAGSGQSQYRYQFTGAASVTKIGFAQRMESSATYDMNGQSTMVSVDMSNSLLTTVTWTAWYANTADTFGTLASPTRTQIATGTITVSSTLAQYYIPISIPAAATTGIEIEFSVGAQTSGTWVIGRAQFEAVPSGATTGTAFEFLPYSEQYKRCFRFIPNFFDGGTGVTPVGPASGSTSTTGVAVFNLLFPSRVPATGIVVSNVAHFLLAQALNITPSGMTFSNSSIQAVSISISVASGWSAGYAVNFRSQNTGAFFYLTGCQL